MIELDFYHIYRHLWRNTAYITWKPTQSLWWSSLQIKHFRKFWNTRTVISREMSYWMIALVWIKCIYFSGRTNVCLGPWHDDNWFGRTLKLHLHWSTNTAIKSLPHYPNHRRVTLDRNTFFFHDIPFYILLPLLISTTVADLYASA